MEKVTLPVKGMDCASCSITIEKTLKKIDGVINCEVNYGNEKAKIEFDSTKTSIEQMSKKIEPLGYSLIKNTSQDHSKHAMHKMSDGAMMMDHEMKGSDEDMSGMDHSEHLGLNQSKEDKLKELAQQKNKVTFIMPITIVVFLFMIWQILSQAISDLPKFFIADEIYNPILLIISTITLFWIGYPFLKEILIFIKYRVSTMYTLVGIGTLTAYVYSTFVVLLPKLVENLGLPMHTYFDVTIVVVGFVYYGKYLETKSKLQTGEAIEKLLNLQAKTAVIERDGKEIEIEISEVKTGDIIIVKPGSKIPVDGVIIEGKSTVDESMITGESLPIDKVINDNVIGGTINKQGAFKFKATKVGSETLLAHIIKMVDEAQGSRAPIQKLADQISGIFVPAVLIISIITLLGWLVIGSQFMSFPQALSIAITCFVGVLVIACPCALGLATPTAIIVGTGIGAKNGILIKDAESLEKFHKVNTIVTDKTGTITNGKPEVTEIKILTQLDEKEVLKILASLEKNSEHPIAEAIVAKAKEENIELYKVDNFEIIEGKGLKGKIQDLKNQLLYAGNLKLLEDLKINFDRIQIDELTGEGKTPVFLSNEKEIIAIVAIADKLKENAKQTVEQLHKLGLKVIMLTGDNERTAKYIASLAGIDEVIAEVLPQDKANKIKDLQSKGNIVAMIGDGVNDAPALAQADIGIAMGTGTDVAIESAQITLLKGDFSKVVQAIKLSRFTMNAIKQNLFWAFSYNIVGIPLAAGLFYPFFGVLLNPAFAGLAMAFSSVTVVANSLRLKFKKL
ncbi:MAG: heavy metal translocating P-type ATPase [Candidatus Dojkabacteria bacterium]